MAQSVAGTTQFKEDAERLTDHVSSWIGIRGAVAVIFGVVVVPSRRSAWPRSS